MKSRNLRGPQTYEAVYARTVRCRRQIFLLHDALRAYLDTLNLPPWVRAHLDFHRHTNTAEEALYQLKLLLERHQSEGGVP